MAVTILLPVVLHSSSLACVPSVVTAARPSTRSPSARSPSSSVRLLLQAAATLTGKAGVALPAYGSALLS